MEEALTETAKHLAGGRLSVDATRGVLVYNAGQRVYPLRFRGAVLDVRAAARFTHETNPTDGIPFFLSSTSNGRQLLREARVPYLTQEGNVHLDDVEAGVYIQAEFGTDSTERHASHPTDYTRNDLRVLFAWLTLPRRLARDSQSALAKYAGVSDAAVTRALAKIEANGYPRHRHYLLPEQLMSLLRSWAEAYRAKLKPTLGHHRFRAIGLAMDWRHLPQLPPTFVYSGVAAAAVDRHDLVSGTDLEVYGQLNVAISHARALRWAPDMKGAVVLHERFWGELPTGWTDTDRSRHATIPLLTYADLLATNEARAVELAERDVLNQCLRQYSYRE